MSPTCIGAAKNFRRNIDRVVSLAMIPAAAFRDGEWWRKVCEIVMREIGTDDEQHPDIGRQAGSMFFDLCNNVSPKESRRHLFEANENVAKGWGSTPHMHGSLHDLLQALAIQTWGAFEALAEDIYSNVLEEQLTSIAIPTDKEIEDNKLFLTSRRAILRTYKYTFKVENSSIVKALKSRALVPLSLVRNLLVHKAGVIDQVFLNARNGIPVLLELRKPGKKAPIELTGGSVRKLIDPVVPIGYELLNSVDRWISANP